MHVIFADELGQISAEEFSVYDIILRNIRGSQLYGWNTFDWDFESSSNSANKWASILDNKCSYTML